MPDSPWQRATDQESGEFESRFEDGDTPADGFGRAKHKELNIPERVTGMPPIRIRGMKVEEWLYSSVRCTPPPQIVLEECDKCETHVHQVKILFGPATGAPPGAVKGESVEPEQHVAPGHFGTHFGDRYVNSRCRGREISRILAIYHDTGRKIRFWSSRTIDHVKNVFVWHAEISEIPCELRKSMKFGTIKTIEAVLGKPARPPEQRRREQGGDKRGGSPFALIDGSRPGREADAIKSRSDFLGPMAPIFLVRLES